MGCVSRRYTALKPLTSHTLGLEFTKVHSEAADAVANFHARELRPVDSRPSPSVRCDLCPMGDVDDRSILQTVSTSLIKAEKVTASCYCTEALCTSNSQECFADLGRGQAFLKNRRQTVGLICEYTLVTLSHPTDHSPKLRIAESAENSALWSERSLTWFSADELDKTRTSGPASPGGHGMVSS